MIFVDTSVWLAFFREKDSFHSLAKEIMLEYETHEIGISVFILEEIITVLTYKEGKQYGKMFVNFVLENNNIHILDIDTTELMKYFVHVNKKVSFADISLLFLAKRYHGTLVSFDKELNKIAKAV